MSLVLNALSISKSECIAQYQRKINLLLKRLKLLGIKKIISLEDYFSINNEFPNLHEIQNEKDLLKIKLPFGFSNDSLYDDFCRIQQSPYVQVNHSNFKENFHVFWNVIISSEKIIKQLKPKYLISSHNATVYYGSLVNAAIRNKSKVITLSIEENSLKFLQ